MNCEHCGTPLAEGASVCSVCGTPVQGKSVVNPAEAPVKERVGLGIIGAIIGALIGGASIVILSQLGYVASISGLLIAFCTLKGYELLAKRLSKVGIAISIVLLIVTPFLANVVDLVLVVYDQIKEFGATLGDAVAFLPELIEMGGIDTQAYFSNLAMLYGFVALGAFFVIRNAFRNV